MNNLNKSFLLFLALSICVGANSAFAAEGGSEGGGGENSVVCFSDPAIPAAIRDQNSPRFGQILDAELAAVSSAEAYDLYEARMPRGLEQTSSAIVVNDQGAKVRAYAEKIAARFAPYLPSVTRLIQSGANKLPDNRILVRPAGLNRIHDENDVGYIDSVHCVVATMAAQYKAGDETLLQMDGRLFGHPLNSRLSQSVLFLHESIYYAARTYAEHKDSRATRTLVGTLINGAPTDTLTLARLMKSLKMPGSDQLDNYLSEMARDFFRTELKSVNAKLVREGNIRNNRQMARFEKWEKIYFPKEYGGENGFSYWGKKTDFFKTEDGNYFTKIDKLLEGYLPSEFFSAKSLDSSLRSNCSNNSVCIQTMKNMLQDYAQNKKELLQLALSLVNQSAAEKLFPAIDQLPQFDAATKAEAKARIGQAIAQGTLGDPKEVSESSELYSYRFGKSGPEQKLRGMAIVIP
ncbi:MAG: hypothetical protein ACXWQO_00650 [Bdellovibrionota bacterium]